MPITGRCYCGAITLTAQRPPQTVAYCHCGDCRRWTGAPLPAFAALAPEDVTVTPPLGTPFSTTPGVERWVCAACGSPIAARFDYLPGQIYIPLGILDQAEALAPEVHCHAEAQMPWLHVADDLPRLEGSGRTALMAATKDQA